MTIGKNHILKTEVSEMPLIEYHHIHAFNVFEHL